MGLKVVKEIVCYRFVFVMIVVIKLNVTFMPYCVRLGWLMKRHRKPRKIKHQLQILLQSESYRNVLQYAYYCYAISLLSRLTYKTVQSRKEHLSEYFTCIQHLGCYLHLSNVFPCTVEFYTQSSKTSLRDLLVLE